MNISSLVSPGLENSKTAFIALFKIILGAEPSYPSHGYYLVLWSEDKTISVDTVICIDGKNAKKIDENNSDEQYSEKQGYVFFKIYESIDAKNLDKSPKGAMDWSELNGNNCSIDLKIEICASNKKIMESPMLRFHDSKEGVMIGCEGKKINFHSPRVSCDKVHTGKGRKTGTFRHICRASLKLYINFILGQSPRFIVTIE